MRRRQPLQSLVVATANFPALPSTQRWRVLRAAGLRVEGPSRIHRGVVLQGEGTLTLGRNCFVNHGTFFDLAADVVLGDRVFLADHVRVLTSSHEFGPPGRRAGRRTAEPVSIGTGCWIGSGSVIMPGVTIGAGSVIGAGSLVTRDCKPDSLYVGAPARFRRELAPD